MQDAVVPDARDSVSTGLPYVPYQNGDMSKSLGLYGPKLESSEQGAVQVNYPSAGFQARNDAALVPQMNPQQPFTRLTASQQAELELARRRAQKAAEGKRANATAARRAKRRAQQRAAEGASDKEADSGEGTSARPPEPEAHGQAESDIEAKLATVSDQKEAKRLKRLLRNRVSAQQARERKKSYVQDLETRCSSAERDKVQLEQRVKVLERENDMLRQVLKNMQVREDTM